MTIERITAAEVAEDELALESTVRPRRLDEFAGQDRVKENLAILIDAAHQCMTTRGVHHRHVSTITTQFTGVFKTDASLRQRFLDFVNKR